MQGPPAVRAVGWQVSGRRPVTRMCFSPCTSRLSSLSASSRSRTALMDRGGGGRCSRTRVPGSPTKNPPSPSLWSCAFSFERMSVHAPKRKKGKRPEFPAALSQGRTEPDNLYSGRKSSGGSGQETVTGPNSDKDCEGRTGSRVGTGTSGPGSRRRALGEQDVGSESRGRPGGDVGRGGRWA